MKKDKQTTQLIQEDTEDKRQQITVSQEQLQREVKYFQAQQLLEAMHDKKLITDDEFNKITRLNREKFHPFLAEIMPGIG